MVTPGLASKNAMTETPIVIELLYTQRGTEAIREGEYLGKVRQHYFDVTVAARPEARLGRARLYLLLGGGVNL